MTGHIDFDILQPWVCFVLSRAVDWQRSSSVIQNEWTRCRIFHCLIVRKDLTCEAVSLERIQGYRYMWFMDLHRSQGLRDCM